MGERPVDRLSQSLAHYPAGRRRLLAGGGGALLTLLGISRARAQDNDLGDSGDQTPEATTESADETPAGSTDDGLCVMEFTATVRTGPSLDDGAGVLSGRLTFRLGEDAELLPADSRLEAEGGNRYPVTGQTRGRAVSLRVNLGPGAVVAIGTAEEAARACAGEIRGVTTGPRAGDLGDWVARAV